MSRKLKIFFNYFLAPILLIWLCINIYNEIVNQKNNAESWAQVKQAFYGNKSWMIVLAIMFTIANWSLEAIKWKILIKPLQQISFTTAIKATLAGSSFAANTPNRVGEYFGRMIYLEEGKRLKSIALTVIGSFSQIIVTLVLGCVAIYFYKKYNVNISLLANGLWLNIILLGSIAVTVVFVIMYFNIHLISKILARLPFIKKYQFFFQDVENISNRVLVHILLLSLLRYFVFLIQYILVLHAFGAGMCISNILIAVGVQFLLMLIIPSFVILEAGIRGTLGVEVFKVFTTNLVSIIAAGYFIWLINLIAPAIVGVLLLIGRKIMREKG